MLPSRPHTRACAHFTQRAVNSAVHCCADACIQLRKEGEGWDGKGREGRWGRAMGKGDGGGRWGRAMGEGDGGGRWGRGGLALTSIESVQQRHCAVRCRASAATVSTAVTALRGYSVVCTTYRPSGLSVHSWHTPPLACGSAAHGAECLPTARIVPTKGPRALGFSSQWSVGLSRRQSVPSSRTVL